MKLLIPVLTRQIHCRQNPIAPIKLVVREAVMTNAKESADLFLISLHPSQRGLAQTTYTDTIDVGCVHITKVNADAGAQCLQNTGLVLGVEAIVAAVDTAVVVPGDC